MSPEPIAIAVNADQSVSGLWRKPEQADACLVLAHGAGAGMAHRSMTAIAEGLAERRIATLRYNFPYMERGSRRTDAPALAHATVRAAVAEAARLAPDLPLFAGGRSFGGRMTSQAQAASALSKVLGLVFFAFPLHPPAKPGVERAEHLAEVRIPLLFLQGSRDEFARLDLLEMTIDSLGDLATLKLLDGADHAFHVPAKSGRRDADVLTEALGAVREWTSNQAG
ncbi:MAG TPA: alpha/beta family hydrolase [Phenylobacterium sp.]|nr:alpha/beta family hydrolase [Phenylobacterium sp.]